MSDALLISNVVLWLAVLALTAVVVALIRQVGILHERIAPAGALVLRGGPRVGEVAPKHEVACLSGARITLGGPAADERATLLFFLSPTCPVCKTLLPALRSLARSEAERMRVVLASDGDPREHEVFVKEERLEAFPYVLSTPLGLAYEVAKLPFAALVDAGGVLRAKGIVNTREHLESLFEAMDRGVADLQEHLERSLRTSGEMEGFR